MLQDFIHRFQRYPANKPTNKQTLTSLAEANSRAEVA